MQAADERALRVAEGLNRAVLADTLARVIARLEINCVIDAGAHRGEYGKLLRGTGYEGEIVSLEPTSDAFTELEVEMAAHPPWNGRRLALGERSGEAEMTVFESSEFSSIGEPTEWGRATFPGLAGGRREPVEVARLDDLFAELTKGVDEPRVLLKIDVQGSEWSVLEGSSGSLPAIAAVQVETAVVPVYEDARPFTEVIERLGEAGFELAGAFPVSRDRHLRIVELDCLMVRIADKVTTQAGADRGGARQTRSGGHKAE